MATAGGWSAGKAQWTWTWSSRRATVLAVHPGADASFSVGHLDHVRATCSRVQRLAPGRSYTWSPGVRRGKEI